MTQTDLTNSDIDNLFEYKDWYVKDGWVAFHKVVKFRQDVL